LNADNTRDLNPTAIEEIVHEWGTQLQAIVSATEFVDLSMPKHSTAGGWEHRVREANHRIKVATDAMYLQMRDLKARLHVQPSHDQQGPMVEQFTVDSLYSDIRAAAKSLQPRNEVQLHFVELDARVQGVVVVSDKQRLVQVARNLIENAVKYTEVGHVRVNLAGSLRWTAKRRPSCRLTLTVEDTGIGIAPEEVDLVTTSGYRSDAVRHLQGSGHGLSLVSRAAESMNGKLKIESALGQGTTVSFEVSVQALSLFADRPRVLVVDDELAPTLERVLTELGCDVVACTSADEALAVFEWDRFDVVLMDINLGGDTSGVQLAKRLVGNATPHASSTPFVAVTAYRMSIPDADTSCFSRIIDKPATAETFARVIKEVTGWTVLASTR
jgi:CheY-like chemotaxis protein